MGWLIKVHEVSWWYALIVYKTVRGVYSWHVPDSDQRVQTDKLAEPRERNDRLTSALTCLLVCLYNLMITLASVAWLFSAWEVTNYLTIGCFNRSYYLLTWWNQYFTILTGCINCKLFCVLQAECLSIKWKKLIFVLLPAICFWPTIKTLYSSLFYSNLVDKKVLSFNSDQEL